MLRPGGKRACGPETDSVGGELMREGRIRPGGKRAGGPETDSVGGRGGTDEGGQDQTL